jgi:2-isopropylmalate synthase
MAAANSVLAVTAGATHVQGTLAGFGERCGNANLSTILASLRSFKLGYDCVPEEALERLPVRYMRWPIFPTSASARILLM